MLLLLCIGLRGLESKSNFDFLPVGVVDVVVVVTAVVFEVVVVVVGEEKQQFGGRSFW